MPSEKQKIKPFDSIIGIVIYSVILMIPVFSKEYFGVWLFDEDKFVGIVPFLTGNMDQLTYVLLLFILGLWILKDGIKLFYERMTNFLASSITVMNSFSLVIILYLFLKGKIWNENLMKDAVNSGTVTIGSDAYTVLQKAWEQSTFWFPILLVIGLVAEILWSFWKANKTEE